MEKLLDIIEKIIPKFGKAGGHDMIAGAQIKIDRRKRKNTELIKKEIVRKILRELNLHPVKKLFRLVTNEEFRL